MAPRLTDQERIFRDVAEKEVLEQFMYAARSMGWLVAHFHDSRRQVMKQGKMVFVGDHDAKGFPDLVLIRPPRLMVVEVKKQTGKTTPEQDIWLAAFQACEIESHVLRPSNFDELVMRLRREPRRRPPRMR